MWKNIPNIVLIVVLVAVIGGSDVSCGCFGNNGKYSVIKAHAEIKANSPEKLQETELGSNDSIAPSGTTGICSRLTKKQLITMSLIAAAITLTSSFAVHRANNSPAKYDIVKEAKQVSSALESSSGSTQDELDRITKSLCTKLPGSLDDPPLNNSTTTASNEYTDDSTIEGRMTEAMTTQLKAEDPGVVCLPAAEKIFGYLKKLIGNLRFGFIGFDVLHNNDVSAIKRDMENVPAEYCGANFFQFHERNGYEGVSFNAANEYVNTVMNNNVCQMAVEKILPVLFELGHDPNTIGHYIPQALDFETNVMKTDFLEGAKIADGINCGHDFFRITGNDDEKKIQYDNSNTYISAGWSKAINDQKCQERADKIIALLNAGGHNSITRIAGKTATAPNYNLAVMRAAYNIGNDCNCGAGALNMVDRKTNLVFSYRNTNPFVLKAWERAPNTVSCIRTAKNILAHLSELGLYSTDDDASIIVPDFKNNIIELQRKFLGAEGSDCSKGFFELISEDGHFKVKYDKNHPYIKPEWDKINDRALCEIAANGIYHLLEAYKKPIVSGSNAISIAPRPFAKEEILRKFDIMGDIDCGNGFFSPTYGPVFVGLFFNTNNQYIKPAWVGGSR